MNVYEFNGVCLCPADNLPDSYSVRLESRRMLWTNLIGDAVAELAERKMSQEQYTHELHRKLQCRVTTVGSHPSFTDGTKLSLIHI